jgi:hypothetical protein
MPAPYAGHTFSRWHHEALDQLAALVAALVADLVGELYGTASTGGLLVTAPKTKRSTFVRSAASMPAV